MSKRSSEKEVERLKSAYLKHARRADPFRVLITGWAHNNIAEAVADRLEKSGAEVFCRTHVDLDISRDRRVRAHFERFRDSQPLSALVNCVGMMDLKWFENYKVHEARRIIETNLVGAYSVSRSFVKTTLHQKHPKYIVHIGSMAGRIPLYGSAPYCASKAGLEMLCRCMALELAPKNFNVLCVLPGNVADTPMERQTIKLIEHFRRIPKEEAEAYWRSGMLRNRLLSKSEVAEVVAFFLEGKCDYMSGGAITLTGGQR